MANLHCEICGGNIVAKAGGIFTCDTCGVQYDKTRLQEMMIEQHKSVEADSSKDMLKSMIDQMLKVGKTPISENPCDDCAWLRTGKCSGRENVKECEDFQRAFDVYERDPNLKPYERKDEFGNPYIYYD